MTLIPQIQAVMVETDTFSHLRAFSPAALECLPTVSERGTWDFLGHAGTGDSMPPRRDLRDSHLICSVDPPGCQDIDDALSARYPGLHMGVSTLPRTHC